MIPAIQFSDALTRTLDNARRTGPQRLTEDISPMPRLTLPPDTRIMAVLVGNPETKSYQELIPYFNQIHTFSGQAIDFYLPGVSKGVEQDDSINLEYKDWQFSMEHLKGFVNELQARTRWGWSGEAELVIFEVSRNSRNLTGKYINFVFQSMLADKVIISPASLIQTLISLAKTREVNINTISNSIIPSMLGQSAIDSEGGLMKFISRNLAYGKHFSVKG